MPPPSKRRKSRPRAQHSTGSAAARLDVARGPIRQQAVQGQRPPKAGGADVMPVFAGDDLIQLINRRAQALGELPLRIALSRTPFEAWRVQHQFALGVINDCEFVALRLMKLALTALPK